MQAVIKILTSSQVYVTLPHQARLISIHRLCIPSIRQLAHLSTSAKNACRLPI
jgi:hypothetical protein